MGALTALIQARGKDRFNSLFSKYGGEVEDEPSEEDFQKTRERMERGKKRQADVDADAPPPKKGSGGGGGGKKVKKSK